MNLGNKLRSTREEYGYTQAKLAKLLDMSQKTISSWERGRTNPKMDDLHRICKIYDCTYEHLTGVKQHDANDITVNDILIKIDSLNLQDLIFLSDHIIKLIHSKQEIEAIQREKMELEQKIAEYNKKLDELSKRQEG